MQFRAPAASRGLMHVSSVAFIVGLFSVAACGGKSQTAEAHSATVPGELQLPPRSPKLAMLSIDTVRAVNERVIATLPAVVVPNENQTVHVTSPVLGRVEALLAQPGDHVGAGQPLARIRSSDAAQATSDVAKAASVLSSTRASLARATDLYEHKVIAARELEQARNDAEQARAEHERARRRASQLGLSTSGVSDDYVLRAPVGGVVIERLVNPGAEVRPDNAAVLFTISSLSQVWLTVNVPQRDLAAVHKGSRLRFVTDAVPGRTFAAAVSFVSDALDPVSRTAIARAVIDNAGGALRVQTSGEAQLIVADVATAAVPSRAVVTHGSDMVVFVALAPGRFARRVVIVRDDDGVTATLSSGVTPGERVVTTGSLLLAGEMDRVQ